ncbi:MAG TPA: DUF1045 domain-containing protein [Candidatus Saccharimonadales bacterium]|nr:DUF1045 domain-containing protein [Candidatus Saccharimonadales bacterium]
MSKEPVIMSSIPCDIVILPSSELAQRAIKMSVTLQSHGALFQLNATGPFPHTSLYMTQLKIADLDKVKAILTDIAASTPLLDLTATRYDQANGFIDVDYARTETLDQLQMTVVEAINPIRDGMREKDKARMLTTTGKARENLEKYGYPGVGELFRPHMTFTRFIDARTIDTSTLPNVSELNGQFVKLGLFEMGENGTCVREIAEFTLGDRK